MSRAATAAICFLVWSAALSAQSPVQKKLDFDLAQIGLVVGGKHFCEDKGRLQDYSSKVMDQIIAAGPKAIPVLIGKITDSRPAGRETDEPIICYRHGMAIGDIAFRILTDLFTDSTEAKTTMPGASWNDMLGPDDRRAGREQFNDFIRKHSRRALQAKWQRLWNKYGLTCIWDAKERCFKLKDK